MFQHNFEFGAAPLISLGSLALRLTLFAVLAGQVGTSRCQIPLDQLCRSYFQSISPESGKGGSERESRFFRLQFLGRRNGRKFNCLSPPLAGEFWICSGAEL